MTWTDHLCTDRKFFKTLETIYSNETVTTCGNLEHKIEGQGSVEFECNLPGGRKKMYFTH